MADFLKNRKFQLGLTVFLVALVIIYGVVSFLIAQGVTKADRDPQEDHPSNYGLVYEDVAFPSRRGDVTLSLRQERLETSLRNAEKHLSKLGNRKDEG